MGIARYFRRRWWDEERAREIASYLEFEIADNIARGMTPENARSAARKKFGNPVLVREEVYRMNTVGFVETVWQDLRHGARLLRLSPGFTAVAVISLALGIGANTAIFQLVDAVRLRSLPVKNPGELAEVRIVGGNHGMGNTERENADMTNPQWEHFRSQQRAFSGVFAWAGSPIALGKPNDNRLIDMLSVSGDFFHTLGVTAARGRLLGPEDDRRGCAPGGAVISYGFWQRELAGRDAAIGTTLMLGEKPFTVIGVTPRGFFGLEVGRSFDVAVPLCVQSQWDSILDLRNEWWLTIMGRLKPGWTLERASAQFGAISPGIFEAVAPAGYDAPTTLKWRELRLAAYPAGTGVTSLRETYDTSLWLLLGITCLVLLIACANLANLMLARAGARRREIAVRLALGASKSRLIRQLLSESLMLAAIGAVTGAGIAALLSRMVVRFLGTTGNTLRLDLQPDWVVLAFTGFSAAATCILFGLAPALSSSRAEPVAAMKTSGRGMTASREKFSFQRLLVVSQISISLVLLVGALLFARSFRNLITLDPGFREKGILVAYASVGRLHLPRESFLAVQRDMAERVRAVPGVESVGASTNIPLSGSSWGMGISIAGGERNVPSHVTWVSPDYFHTMGIQTLAGRDFNDRDTGTSPGVAIVNETFARKYLTGKRAIGSVLRTAPEPGYPESVAEIIGVVKNTKYGSLREEIEPSFFLPLTQFPDPRPWTALVIHTSLPARRLIEPVRRGLEKWHPDIELNFRPLDEQIDDGLVRERLMAALSGFFGGLALLLAAIGLYGVISYIVLRRRNEIGIRVALGASRGQVLGLVMREAGLMLGIGLPLGIGLSILVARTASTLLFGLQPYDPVTLAAAAALLAVIAVAAAIMPARRAARLDPMSALRYE